MEILKKYILIIGVLLWWGCDKTKETPPDEQQAPDVVIKAITGQFAGVQDFTLTTMQDNAVYAAVFYSEMDHYRAVVAQDGTIRILEKEQPVAALEPKVTTFLSHHFSNPDIVYMFTQIHPSTGATLRNLVKITVGGDAYLITFDTLGARVAIMKEPQGDWWRYPVTQYSDLPQNVRTTLESAHPGWTFRDASMFVDIHRTSTWQVTLANSNFLSSTMLDANANIVSDTTEDLMNATGPDKMALDLNSVSALPTEISDFLNAQFTGWVYQRAVLVLENNNPLGFSVFINVNGVDYYTRYDTMGIFIGAARG